MIQPGVSWPCEHWRLQTNIFLTSHVEHMGFLGTHREHLQLQCPTCDTGSVCESVAGLIHCPAVHPSLHPSILLQSWQQSTEGNLPPGRPALERWVGVLIDSRSVGGKEEFALSCQTSRWIEAYMMMLRVEYTCSFLLGGRGEKTERCCFFCCVSSTSCWD